MTTARTIQAIPTVYNGVRYRSRLEARWAATFDLLKWPHAYEPFDLNWYVPDFVLLFEAGPVLVEVKPALFLEELRVPTRKIERSGWNAEYLVVGAELFATSDWYGPTLGLIGERDEPEWVPPSAAQTFWCLRCESVSFHSESGSYRCRACGAAERHRAATNDLPRLWSDAGNLVQWKGSTP
jgi:hypothetical protein